MCSAACMTGRSSPIRPRSDDWKWIALRDLKADMLAKPEAYTVWFRQYVGAHGALIADWIERGARALQ